MFVQIVERPPHNKKSWQYVDKNSSDPGCHCMGLRGSEVNIQNYDCHTYAENRTKQYQDFGTRLTQRKTFFK